MYRVIEVARKLNVSKVTIYKKIKKNKKIQDYVIKKNKITYIKPEGVEEIKKHLNKFKKDFSKELINEKWNEEIHILKDYLKELEKENVFLKEEFQKQNKKIALLKKIYKLSKENLSKLSSVKNMRRE